MFSKPDTMALLDSSSHLKDAETVARRTRNRLTEALDSSPENVISFVDFADGALGEEQLKERLEKYEDFKKSHLDELIEKDSDGLIRHLRNINQLYATHIQSLNDVIDSAKINSELSIKDSEYYGYTRGRLVGGIFVAVVVLAITVAISTLGGS